MKKAGLLARLEQLKARNEDLPAEDCDLTPIEIVDLLLDYINDPQIREAVDEITF